jgi:hypothetical protein
MNRFKPKRRSLRKPKARGVDLDTPMVSAGKQFLEVYGDVAEDTDGLVLFVVDVRDPVGAVWAAGRTGVGFDGMDEFIERVLHGPNGEKNTHPFVSFWMPRSAEMLELLERTGLKVPRDWRVMLETPAPPGTVYTILKRRGETAFFTVDYSKVPSIRGTPIRIQPKVRERLS